MKKRLLTFFILILLLGSVLYAEESFRLDTSLGGTISIAGIHLGGRSSISYKPGLFGGGAGVKTYYGFDLQDLYVAPHVKLDIGSFYLGAGPLFMLTPERSDAATPTPSEDMPVIPFATAGFAFGIMETDLGKLGLDISIDLAPTAVRAEGEGLDFLGAAFAAALGSFKVYLGFLYIFKF